jgi:hypothetical protein
MLHLNQYKFRFVCQHEKLTIFEVLRNVFIKNLNVADCVNNWNGIKACEDSKLCISPSNIS